MAKKKKVAKKKTTKATPRHIVEVRVRAESVQAPTALVPITPKDLDPVKEGRKMMIPKTWVSERQASFIVQKTPKQFIKTRAGRGGQTYSYIPGHYFKRALKFGFGWNWDFFIDDQEAVGLGESWGQVITRGHLVVKDDEGHTISKSDNGKADIKYLKGTKTPMDLGNDFKASATDCLKRCAVQLGIGSDVYGADEMKSAGYTVAETNAPQKPQSAPQSAAPAQESAPLFCNGADKFGCPFGSVLTQAEFDYSKQLYKKPLCRECQKNLK